MYALYFAQRGMASLYWESPGLIFYNFLHMIHRLAAALGGLLKKQNLRLNHNLYLNKMAT